MDIDEVRALSDAELDTELSAAKRNLYDLRFQLATRQLNDYTQIRRTRKHIARVMMVQAERQAVGALTEAER
jgi:large subunit ribosomal protein L29